MPLHLKYRPRSFDEFRGNAALVKNLRAALDREDHPHSFLFYGPSGMGKTTLARLVGDHLGCSKTDFYEFNAANTRGIDTVREISIGAQYRPLSGGVKVYLLDECHQLTGQAAEALLKVLEDTPEHAYFCLCTTEPERLTATIRNRCASYCVSGLARSEMFELLEWVLSEEGITDLWPEVVTEIVRNSGGCPRAALVTLDKVIGTRTRDLDEALAVVVMGVADPKSVVILCRTLLDGRFAGDAKWREVVAVLKSLDSDAESVRRSVLGYMSKVLLNGKRCEHEAARIASCFLDPYYSTGEPGLVLSCYRAVCPSKDI